MTPLEYAPSGRFLADETFTRSSIAVTVLVGQDRPLADATFSLHVSGERQDASSERQVIPSDRIP